MSFNKHFPETVDDLVRDMAARFPEPAIGPDDTMDKIKFDAGQRSVARFYEQWRANPQREAPATPRRGAGRPV